MNFMIKMQNYMGCGVRVKYTIGIDNSLLNSCEKYFLPVAEIV